MENLDSRTKSSEPISLIELAEELIASGKTSEKKYVSVIIRYLTPIREKLGLNPATVKDNTSFYSPEDIQKIRNTFLIRSEEFLEPRPNESEYSI